jgi:hypothetical protein
MAHAKEYAMKRSNLLMLCAATLLVAVACIGSQQLATAGPSTVSDHEAAMLFGGACENGHKFSKDSSKSCGDVASDDKPYKGCKWKQGWKDDGAGGSNLDDGTDNCGVSECGTVTKTKPCS